MLKVKWGWGYENTRETAAQATVSVKLLSAFPTLSIFFLKNISNQNPIISKFS